MTRPSTVRPSERRPGTYLISVVPGLAVLLNVFVWIAGISRAGFWADDFFNLTTFNRSLGDLSNTQINRGRYVTNLFWAIGTDAFGTGSVVPFLLLTSLLFGLGTFVWLRSGSRGHWSSASAWWVAAFFLATAMWFPTALWSSDVTHSCGYLALGLGMLAHQRCMAANTRRIAWHWSIFGGAAWTLAQVSSIQYLGLIAIALYATLHQVLKLRELGVDQRIALAGTSSWNLVLPVIYFAAIDYPATTAVGTYAHSSLSYVRGNFDFYRLLLAPTTLLVILYGVLGLLAIAVATAALRRSDFFPAAVLVAAAATLLPALVQSQQRYPQYVAMPLLLMFSSVAAGLRPALMLGAMTRMRGQVVLTLVATIALVLIFHQGATERSVWGSTPWGSQLTTFRSQVASLTPAGAVICARLNGDPMERAAVIGAMSGDAGFMVPPIEASQVYLLTRGQPCPVPPESSTSITISVDSRGDLVASR